MSFRHVRKFTLRITPNLFRPSKANIYGLEYPYPTKETVASIYEVVEPWTEGLLH